NAFQSVRPGARLGRGLSCQPHQSDRLQSLSPMNFSTNKPAARYWRSLAEEAQTKEFQESLDGEFSSEWSEGVSRRNFLKGMGASLALAGLSACTREPVHPIVLYRK